MGTRGTFLGARVARAWSWPLTSIWCWVQRMNGAIPPLPKYVFIVWCLFKHRGNFTFAFTQNHKEHIGKIIHFHFCFHCLWLLHLCCLHYALPLSLTVLSNFTHIYMKPIFLAEKLRSGNTEQKASQSRRPLCNWRVLGSNPKAW